MKYSFDYLAYEKCILLLVPNHVSTTQITLAIHFGKA